jgi:peptidoglycan-associated lipoprotein
MRVTICVKVLLVSVGVMLAAAAGAQDASPIRETPVSVDLAITYAAERGQIAPSNCGCFWMNGAGAEAAVNFRRGFGLVASLSGSTTSNVAPGVDVNRIVYMVGERYTHALRPAHKTANQHGAAAAPSLHRVDFFAQWLVGGVHGFDGVYPATGGVVATANGFATQLGGGLNMALSKRLGLRLLDAEYLHTSLPNNTHNTQNDTRLGAGFIYRFGR